MEVHSFIMKDIDLHCCGNIDGISDMERYLQLHSSKLDIQNLIDRLLFNKLKVYTKGKTLIGKVYAAIISEKLKQNDLLIDYQYYLDMLFLKNPDKMSELLGFNDIQKEQYLEEILYIYDIKK